jgi:hypothetical protein
MMKMRSRKMLAGALGVGVLALSALGALATGYFPGFPIAGGASYCAGTSVSGTCAVTVPAGPVLTGNELVPADTQLPSGQQPQTVLIPTGAIAGATWTNSRNLLGNGALNGTQVNGTSAVTCATTSSPTTAALSADRWVCDVNVGSGIGTTTVITASPTPPVGFANAVKVVKGSSSLGQPICVWQAVPNADSLAVAGQSVTFSAYVAALAAMDNGNVANLVIISGTGVDQGFNGAWTATPAITPAWTGISTVITTPIVLTTGFARFSTTAVIPATATEIGVGVCWTPATTAGAATDGLAFTGAQLERGTVPSLFEFKPRGQDIAANQAFVWSTTAESSTVVNYRAMCAVSTTSATKCGVKFPQTMYKTPTMVYATGFASCTTVACTAVSACTSLATDAVVTGPTTDGVNVVCGSSAAFAAAGSAGILTDLGSGSPAGKITAWTGL